MSYRPQDKTIIEVLEYLQAIHLYVAGPVVDLENGFFNFSGNQLLNPEEVVRYRRLREQGRLHKKDF